MIKSLILSTQRIPKIKIEWYHLLEHCLVEEIQVLIENSDLKEAGIVLEAETFIDGFNIEIIFNETSNYNHLLEIIRIATKNVAENKIMLNQIEILNEEVTHSDLTSEEKLLYNSIITITGQNIEELYCKINKLDFESIQNFFKNIDYRMIYTDKDSFEIIQHSKLNTIKVNEENSNVYKHEPYLNGFIKSEISTTKEFMLLSLLSFMIGKSNNSILDKQYLNKNNYYLGYTHDITIYGIFIILFVAEYKKHTEFINNDSMLSFVRNCNFLMYKNAFITYFCLTETPRSIAKIFSRNLNKFSTINYKQLIQQIHQINKKDLLNFIELL
ncbi:hypothetical protein HB839_11525 [Listeria sp. FSL L7-1699]|uniref:Uncharacterized protein n=1 Tax=Listeria farberi TaxID=2713500 RepID=A0ABR6SPF8_9LIST|nr:MULTISPECIES: hypothetical protein [Listeria]MBC1376157.1 hypothetical protein [Listeria farberi]MBC1380226.1 hypothetical protein [Listeria farberi]MBC1382984.1 hypothetical protein [Listeria innocua]MBC1908550.1 hypothetical protein [Listeria innocua]MBC1927446.1 hypothetical protein [Listeria innocua]